MAGQQDIFQQAMNQGHSAAWDQLWDRAAGFYRQALDEIPEHPQALMSLGLALYELQSYEEALNYYQKAARRSPNDPVPMEKVAQLFERLGRLPQASQTYLRAAELYLKNRVADKAIENWRRVTRLDPENLTAHSRLGMVYEHSGEKQKAVQAYLAVASVYQSKGDPGKAARSVQHALKIAPNDERALRALELLRDNKSLPKPARQPGGTAPLRMAQVRQLESSTSGTPSEARQDPIVQAQQAALTELAGMLFDVSEEDPQSRRGLQAIMSGMGGGERPVDRTRVILHLSQMVDLQTQQKYAQAAEELERAMEAGLDHAAAYYDLAYLHYQQENLEAALPHLQVALKHPDFALGARLMAGDIQARQEDWAAASIVYLEALGLADAQMVPEEQADDLRQLYEPLIESQRQQENGQAQMTLCQNVHDLLMQSDWKSQLAQARQQLEGKQDSQMPVPVAEILLEARSSQVVELLTEINRLADNEQIRSAMEEAFYALQYAPGYLPLHTKMAELLVQQGNLQDAIAKFMVVARTYSIRGELHRAVDIYRRVVEFAPMDLMARNRLIEMLVAQEKVEDALHEYLALAEVYYSQADLDMARKTYTAALWLAQQSRVDRSWRVSILHGMADIDLQSLDWRQALRVFEQVRTLQPDDEKSRSQLIDLNYRLGQEKQALAELDDFISFMMNGGRKQQLLAFVKSLAAENPERAGVHWRLAELYRKLGQVEAAISELDMVGEMLLDAGDRTGAARAIQSIVALNPPNVEDYRQVLAELQN